MINLHGTCPSLFVPPPPPHRIRQWFLLLEFIRWTASFCGPQARRIDAAEECFLRLQSTGQYRESWTEIRYNACDQKCGGKNYNTEISMLLNSTEIGLCVCILIEATLIHYISNMFFTNLWYIQATAVLSK